MCVLEGAPPVVYNSWTPTGQEDSQSQNKTRNTAWDTQSTQEDPTQPGTATHEVLEEDHQKLWPFSDSPRQL